MRQEQEKDTKLSIPSDNGSLLLLAQCRNCSSVRSRTFSIAPGSWQVLHPKKLGLRQTPAPTGLLAFQNPQGLKQGEHNTGLKGHRKRQKVKTRHEAREKANKKQLSKVWKRKPGNTEDARSYWKHCILINPHCIPQCTLPASFHSMERFGFLWSVVLPPPPDIFGLLKHRQKGH